MKKLLLFLCMMGSITSMTATGFEETNFNKYKFTFFHARYYNVNNTFYVAPLVYTVTGNNTVSVCGADLDATTIVIPENVKNEGKTYRVTSIHGYAFQWCSALETLTIPATVDYIYTSTSQEKTVYSSGPFAGCKSLKTINNLAKKAQGFWNSDAKGRNLFRDIATNRTVNTPAGSDYTDWAKYIDGLKLHVTTNAAGCASFCIDKAVKIETANAIAYIVKKNGEKAEFARLYEKYIPAGTAVILKGQANSDIVLSTTVIPQDIETDDTTDNLLIGTLESQKAQGNGQFYVLSNAISTEKDEVATFEPVSAGTCINKNTAYLLSDVVLSNTNLKHKTRTTTGINKVEGTKTNSDYIDLSGHKTVRPQKGIYIQKGKKEYHK